MVEYFFKKKYETRERHLLVKIFKKNGTLFVTTGFEKKNTFFCVEHF